MTESDKMHTNIGTIAQKKILGTKPSSFEQDIGIKDKILTQRMAVQTGLGLRHSYMPKSFLSAIGPRELHNSQGNMAEPQTNLHICRASFGQSKSEYHGLHFKTKGI